MYEFIMGLFTAMKGAFDGFCIIWPVGLMVLAGTVGIAIVKRVSRR